MGDGVKRTLAAESCWGASPYLMFEMKLRKYDRTRRLERT